MEGVSSWSIQVDSGKSQILRVEKLLSGEGERVEYIEVPFNKKFNTAPQVHASLSLLDFEKAFNTRL
jgi:hypothetical protein